MVDCRPAGAPPHDIPHPNGATENHSQAGPTGDMAAHASVRASTPATFAPACAPGAAPGVAPGAAPYCASLVWCAPPPPPPAVNPHVHKSVQPSGADLPMNDIATLRFYFNLGVECMWAAYGPPPQPQPPRHYAPRDLVQEMQQISIHDRPAIHDHKHKPQDNKPPLVQHKGNGQRPLLGPRFKRGNNQDGGNQNINHNQNKGHNNNMHNKGPNNRRNSYMDARYVNPATAMTPGTPVVEECPEPPLVTFPYIPYPPPMYPMPYYHVDSDPAMMGVMGGYMGYEEGVEYAPVQHYYPPPYPPQPQPHPEHK